MAGGCGRRRHGFDNPHGAVGGNERLVGDAPDVRLAYFVEIFDLVEEFAPIVVAGLIQGEVGGQTLVVIQPAQQVGFRPGTNHFQLLVADVLFLQPVDFDMNRIRHFLGSVAGQRHGVKSEQVGILVSGQAGKAGGIGGDFFVPHQGAVET